MSWFNSNKKADVHRTINRILNSTVSIVSHMQIDAATDQRDDIRVARTTPVVILPLTNEDEEDQITMGLTQDLSCEGMAISTLGELPVGIELAIGIGSGGDFSVFLCECVRSQAIGYGFYESGVHLHELLPSKDYVPLKQFAHYLEATPPKSMLSLLAAAKP